MIDMHKVVDFAYEFSLLFKVAEIPPNPLAPFECELIDIIIHGSSVLL